MLPIDMKNLERASELCTRNWFSEDLTYPKVAPDPSIYCPSVLITPFGPAPYLMMLTEPGRKLEGLSIVQERHPCAIPNINPMITPTAGA
jgi:hypothetical protein